MAAGAIERGREDAGVNEAMLLRVGCDTQHGRSDSPQRNLDSESPIASCPPKLSQTGVSKRRSFDLNKDTARFPGFGDESRRPSMSEPLKKQTLQPPQFKCHAI